MLSKKASGQSLIFYKKFSEEFSSFLSEKKYSSHFILVDDNTVNSCLPVFFHEISILKTAKVIEIFSGESFKNIETVQQVWEQLTEQNADRRSVLINLGGGMVGDLGGFAAGTYKRGIDFIHVPTTVLSQVDAAYGGKQGIDFQHFKNQVGIFRNPVATFVNVEFLKTLPPEQLTNGFAEVVKHGLLAGGKFWKQIHAIDNLSTANWKKIVRDSAAIKLSVVEKDPFEKGLRKILNFGHTIGHAVETNLLNRGEEVLHGYCIAAGMIGELFLSQQLCGFSEKKMLEVISFIRNHFPSINMDASFDEEVLNLMKQDKKNRDGRIQFALLQKIGEPVIGVEGDEQLIRQSLDYIRSIYQ
ncbi:MAG TPA: 3-dehydroquinate synthase [Chitinophagales bacterium]|nr:3-dehydroquinate synthase [Chitinophagales bacterium]